MVHLRYAHVVAVLLFWMVYGVLIQSTTGVLTRGISHELLALTGPMLAYGAYRRHEVIPLKVYLPVYLVIMIALLVGWGTSSALGLTGFIMAGVSVPAILCLIRTAADGEGSLFGSGAIIFLVCLFMGLLQGELTSITLLMSFYLIIALSIDTIGDMWHED